MCRLSVRAAEAQVLEGRAGVRALSAKLSLAPLNEAYLDVAGPSSIQEKRHNYALLKWRPVYETRLALRILSDSDDLPAAQRCNADVGADVRLLWTASASRGVAIVAGEKDFVRVHTDGRITLALVLRSAAWVVAAAKLDLKADVSNLSFGIRALQKLVAAGVLVQDADCTVRAGPKLLRLRQEIDEEMTAADVLSFWLDCAFVSGRFEAHCIPGCWAGVYHWMVTAWPLRLKRVRTEFGVVGRVAALDAFHALPEYYSLYHIYFQNIMFTYVKGLVLDRFFSGVYAALIVRFYDPATGALAAREYKFTRKLVEAILYGGFAERVRLSQEDPTVRALVADAMRLSLDLEAPATGLQHGNSGKPWMLTDLALLNLFSAGFLKNGRYPSTLFGGLRFVFCARNAAGAVELVLDKGRFLERNPATLFWARAARDAACASDAARDAARKYDAECHARWFSSVAAPSLDADAISRRDAAIEMERSVAAGRTTAEADRRAAGGFRQRVSRTQTVVPPPTAATLATFALPAATAPLVPGLAPPSVAAPPMPLPNPWERDEARARKAGLPPRAPPRPPGLPKPRGIRRAQAAPSAATIAARERRAAVVPPAPDSPPRFTGVSWESGLGLWRAEYNYAKPGGPTREGPRPRRHLGYYDTEQLAARARHKHICGESLQAFNLMDAWDDAAGVMVPLHKKKRPRPEPSFTVVDGSESRSGRVRKATKR